MIARRMLPARRAPGGRARGGGIPQEQGGVYFDRLAALQRYSSMFGTSAVPPRTPPTERRSRKPIAFERTVRLPLQLGLPTLVGFEDGPRTRAEGTVVEKDDVRVEEKLPFEMF